MTGPSPDFAPDRYSATRPPAWPDAWFVFCASRELKAQPVYRQTAGGELVAFRTATGNIGILNARCIHMGANLANGKIVGETLQCPFHHWQFAPDGRCVAIPAQKSIPAIACQQSFAVEERHGCVFFYSGARPRFPLPFFEDCGPRELARAEPFTIELDCPWYMVGANGVDVQHFRTTHGRLLLEPPAVERPAPFVHRTISRFAVAGQSMADALTRRFAGGEVTMEVTDWAGTLFFVRASFRRTQTYGMVALLPMAPRRTLLYVTVAVRRSRTTVGRWLIDPVNAQIRRKFIEIFLREDIERASGTDYHWQSLIEADRLLADYFAWLAAFHGSAG